MRSAPSRNELVMIDSVAGESTRAGEALQRAGAEQQPARVASAQISEQTANAAVPAMNTRRRPSRSAARPPSSRKPANVIV